MEKNNTVILGMSIPLIWGILMMAIVVGVGLFVMDKVIKSPVDEMYINCCNGSSCTDTYYLRWDNSCHLSLCENNVFARNCTYPGRNITINIEAI